MYIPRKQKTIFFALNPNPDPLEPRQPEASDQNLIRKDFCREREVQKQTVCRQCDGMNRGTDDSSPHNPAPPQVAHPSFPTSLPPSFPRHLEPASHDTRGREGAMMEELGIGGRKTEGGPQRPGWRRGEGKQKKMRQGDE